MNYTVYLKDWNQTL